MLLARTRPKRPATWSLHGRVLSALVSDMPGESSSRAADATGETSQTVLDFVEQHGLAVSWCEMERRRHGREPTGVSVQRIFAALMQHEREATALYLIQSGAIRELTQSLDQAGLRHALLKGPAWRDEIYGRPYARTATDIDVLVHEDELPACRRRLMEMGFARMDQGRRGHEETWVRGSVDVDLHWSILAPGRMPSGTVKDMLARRIRTSSGHWRLCNEDMVAVSLVHLAITKYVCSRHAGLNRILDLLLAAQRLVIDWDQVATTIRRLELGGAAWATVYWIECMSEATSTRRLSGIPRRFADAVRPPGWRARYLGLWVKHDLPGKFEPHAAWLVRLAFTLPMHDSIGAATRAATSRLLGRSP